jgi:hypothetical protein
MDKPNLKAADELPPKPPDGGDGNEDNQKNPFPILLWSANIPSNRAWAG